MQLRSNLLLIIDIAIFSLVGFSDNICVVRPSGVERREGGRGRGGGHTRLDACSTVQARPIERTAASVSVLSGLN